MLFILAKITRAHGPSYDQLNALIQSFPPDAVPALVYGVNTVARFQLGDC
jgi:hypothetical protein